MVLVYLDIDKDEISSIKIYPLPVTDKLFIELDFFDEVQEIFIHDINQRIVYSSNEILSNKNEINVSNFESGIYFVVLLKKNEKIIKKIVKE